MRATAMRIAGLSRAATATATAGPAGKRGFAAAAGALEKTAFYDLHVELKGKMVPFAGYELPSHGE